VTNTAFKQSFGQVSEFVFMILMPVFFARLGIKKMLLLGMTAWIVRYIAFAFGNADALVWMFWLGIVLHGVCYDFFFVTGQIYVDRKAPKEVQASAQGFIAFVTYGVGMVIGNMIAGKVVDMYKVGEVHNWQTIWLIPAAMAAVVAIAFLLTFREPKAEPAPEAKLQPQTK
jgi:MFS family permease